MKNFIKDIIIISFSILMLVCCSHKENGYEYVDLGLPSGNLWATCNVGAIDPEDCGHYFAWGETSPKQDYSWNTYKYSIGDSVMTKYNLNRRSKHADGKIFLSAEDDAASVNMGLPWVTPTLIDFAELEEGCKWDTIKKYKDTGVTVIVGTSKFNGKTIYFPVTDYYDNSVLKNDAMDLTFWTSDLNYDIDEKFKKFYIIRTNYNSAIVSKGYNMNRCVGYPVRAIIRGKNNQFKRDSIDFCSYYFLKYDKIEDTPKYKSIIERVENEVADSIIKVPMEMDFYCYIYFDIKKDILKKYGIDWNSPADMNPDFEF